MIELRKDPISSRCVIINDTRDFQFEINDIVDENTICPFCVGNEKLIPSPIVCYDKNGNKIDKYNKNWKVKIIPNNKPILTIEGNISRKAEGLYDRMTAVGAHEILIESQEHQEQNLKTEDFILNILAVQDRINDLKNDLRLEYILVFKNHGKNAGSTITHPHFQLVALPIIPRSVKEEMTISKKYYDFKERCLFCDIIDQEITFGTRVVMETNSFISLVPFASRYPFETRILPKEHLEDFRNLRDKHKIEELAEMITSVFRRLRKALGKNVPYNLVLHSYPLKQDRIPHYHWYIEVIPKITKFSGFEFGSGLYVNPVVPEESAKFLKEAE
jgi:UDPglucose--hexose-1-phosphate uridylyltransferase